MGNLTFDLETLGNSVEAPIIQIGAVEFDDDGKPISQFLETINIEHIPMDNFTYDMRNIKWWFSQGQEAIKSVILAENSKTMKKVFSMFRDYTDSVYKSNDSISIWSHATFDPPILDRNFRKIGVRNPFRYKDHKDIRTLHLLKGSVDVKRIGTHHNALDDCMTQALYISKMLKL